MSKIGLLLAFVLFAGGSLTARAAEPLKFNYRNADIVKVLEDYSKVSGQRFIISPSIRGKITIINPTPITQAEAFNQLSTALAANGVGISTQDDVMYVSSAREIQRNLIPVVTELPPVRPERMVTMVFQLKHASAENLNKQIRIFTSRDGELVPYIQGNQLLISDWTPNLARVAKVIHELDQPTAKKSH